MSEGVEGLEVQRVEALLGLGRGAQAEAAARALVGADPGSAVALLLLARALLLQHTYPAAAEAARAAIALEPDNAAAHRILADALVGLDPAAAIEAAQHAVEMAPHDPIAHYVLARALNKGSVAQRREAVTVAERVVSMAPFWAEAANLLGLTLSDVGRNKEARAAYLRALELDPNHGFAKNNLAALELDRGRLGRAARSLTSALADEPQDHTLHQNLDLLLLKLLQRIWWGTLLAALLILWEVIAEVPWVLRFLTGAGLLGFMAVMIHRSAGNFPKGVSAIGAGLFRRANAQGKRLIVLTAIAVACVVAMAVLPGGAAARVGVMLFGGLTGLGQLLILTGIAMAVIGFVRRAWAGRANRS